VEQVLGENAGRWETASPRDLARVEALAKAVMSRLLHEPTIRLRSLSEDRGHASLELVRELFGLRDEQTSRPPAVARPHAAGSSDTGPPAHGSAADGSPADGLAADGLAGEDRAGDDLAADGLAGEDRAGDDLAEVRQLRRRPAR
jgi:hypothetical protein